jgi:tRNA pseudouridine32 synthase / 23S rRNA pseudouridine746 synthase
MRVAAHGDEGASHAVTYYAVVETSAQKLAWVSLKPVTGRTHQLRVHCAAMGWPILGDAIYGNAPRQGGPGLQLHAAEVLVPLYPRREPIRVRAPVPEHMRALLAQCGWMEGP